MEHFVNPNPYILFLVYMDFQQQHIKNHLEGVSLDSAFHSISTDIKPVQIIEALSEHDISHANNIASNINTSYTSNGILENKLNHYRKSEYDESNLKKSINYIPDKNDELNLEYKQYKDQYNMLMAASIVSGISISVLIAMMLAKNV